MAWWKALLGIPPADSRAAQGPRAMAGGATELTINTPAELEAALRQGFLSGSGQPVTETTAMKVAAVFGCVRVRSGAVANVPVGIKRRVDDRTRADATDHPVWTLLNRKPNRWQTPSAFKRMMEAHVLLRGEAFAAITRGFGGRIIELVPLHPDRVSKRQLSDLSMEYTWTRFDGSRVRFAQGEILHLTGLSLDGINGCSVLKYARETIGLSLSMEQHGATTFANGANVSAAFKLPQGRTLTGDQVDNLRNQLDEFRQGGAKDGKAIVLEDGMDYVPMGLTAEDAQWLAGREFSRTDICMFFGVPPHLIGITTGNTQLGSSIESQTQSFLTFGVEDSFVMWEEAIGLQCLDWIRNPELYARFNRNALVRTDIKTRWEAYTKRLQWGVSSPNEIRQLEDENPRPEGDIYYPPPNMTAGDNAGAANVDSKPA